jgi:SAM-dependent methyltransferase
MNQDHRRALDGLQPLDRRCLSNESARCKVCGSSAPFFDVTDFNKCAGMYLFGPAHITVTWHRCTRCGFLFTTFFDDWTPADFRRYIYNDDYVKVDPEYTGDRPRRTAAGLALMLKGQEDARILDYGSGSGVFSEHMHELGFKRTENYDPFSSATMPTGLFDFITCVEVIEHVPQPRHLFSNIRSLLNQDGCVLIGEALQPPDIETIRCSWWYVAPRNGHISMFADRTLAIIANQFGMSFHRGDGGLHAMHRGSKYLHIAGLQDRALHTVRLCAPADKTSASFSGLESDVIGTFRWTTDRKVRWSIKVPDGPERIVQVRVPWAHVSSTEYWTGCTLQLGDQVKQASNKDGHLTAEFSEIGPGAYELVLNTPPLKHEPGGRDIGIALLVC